jgi:UDP-3-O-[3-hydroxymyristoyl] glucosamine N-acyltransferase
MSSIKLARSSIRGVLSLKLSALAATLGLELRGEDGEISGVNTLEKAGSHELSFLANPKYASLLSSTRARAVIVDAANADRVNVALVSEHPYLDFSRALELFAVRQGAFSGVSPLAYISEEVELGEGCVVFPFVFIGPRAVVGAGTRIFPGCYVGEDCRIGARCVLYPQVTLMAGVTLGSDSIVNPGAVIGGDGFGFAPSAQGLRKIPQVGRVEVGDHVEIGANATIDRAALDVTRIGHGVKIDNLVQIGHNVQIGDHSILVAQVGVSGSTKIGRGVTVAGQAGVSGHLEIGDGATIGPQAGVGQSVPAGKTVGGSPAMDRATYLRWTAAQPKLPGMAHRIKLLEKELSALKQALAQGESHE